MIHILIMAALILGILIITLHLGKTRQAEMKEDPRINTHYMSIRDFLFVFILMAGFNGFHMWLYQVFYTRGLLDTNVRFVVNFLMTYVFIISAFITGLLALFRQTSWNRPMKKISEAVHKVAKGDFSVRIPSLRKDGKKDYVEIMFEDFNTMAQELQNVEILQNDFIANVSHEIKTPLAIIQNYAVALQGGRLSADERNDYCNTIVEASQKLSTLVSNILKLNKLENQEILPGAHSFDLSEQLRRCAVVFEDLWEEKNINFNVELEECIVCYNENMLEIVWNNLISNAIKFTNPGGSIFIKLKAQDEYVLISVSDTGCGMDEDTQKRIFDKFYQGDSSHTHEGNGLGLALVKRTVTLLGGTITVESQPGEGSNFTVCLKI